MYQPKVGVKCLCKKGAQRDNCANCEGTGMRIDFAKIREQKAAAPLTLVPGSLKFDGKFTIEYELSDGTFSYFRVMTDVGQKIDLAVNAHEELVQLAKDYAALLAANGCDYVDGRLCHIHTRMANILAKAEGKWS